jgi:hypothetical protein
MIFEKQNLNLIEGPTAVHFESPDSKSKQADVGSFSFPLVNEIIDTLLFKESLKCLDRTLGIYLGNTARDFKNIRVNLYRDGNLNNW